MKYYLLFALKLKREESVIVYETEDFVDKPISISTPEITNIIRDFVDSFEQAAIVESPKLQNAINKKMANSNDTSNKSVAKNKHCKDELEQKAGFLRGVAGKAYICQMKELDRAALKALCFELTSYLKKCVSNISPEKILSDESSPYFAGIREAVELRNYLSRFVESQKKIYQNGYIYIMPI